MGKCKHCGANVSKQCSGLASNALLVHYKITGFVALHCLSQASTYEIVINEVSNLWW